MAVRDTIWGLHAQFPPASYKNTDSRSLGPILQKSGQVLYNFPHTSVNKSHILIFSYVQLHNLSFTTIVVISILYQYFRPVFELYVQYLTLSTLFSRNVSDLLQYHKTVTLQHRRSPKK